MRESEKNSLDVRLHTRIIDSIIRIQRWFRCLLQRRKYLTLRVSTITIQSYFRMYLAQKSVSIKRAHNQAATVIQSMWRMHITRKWYCKLRAGIVIVQAHIRGKLARILFKRSTTYRQKMIKDRYKLRPTQSLPVNDRYVKSF